MKKRLRQLTRCKSSKAVIRYSSTQGNGVYAKRKIRRGTRVFLFAETVKKIQHHSGCHCAICKRCISVGPFEYLWPAPESFGWYLNHSCEPNCGMKGYFIVAMRTIRPGEEITIDYSTTSKDPLWKMRCLCGQPTCRKLIRSVIHMTPEWFTCFRGWMPPFIEQAYLTGANANCCVDVGSGLVVQRMDLTNS